MKNTEISIYGMRHFAVWVLILLTNFPASSQAKPFGDLSMEEMNMSSCPYDSSAIAMILFDKGEAEMDVNLGSKYKRHVRIKIFKKEAADKWASKSVFFEKNGENFGKFKASTYNLVNGKIEETKISDDAFFKGKYDKYTNQARFTLPKINDGSIIEYTYIISSSELSLVPPWQFQYEIPVLWSEYIIRVPDYFTLRKDWQGFYQARSEVDGIVERLTMGNIPAFKAEPYMTSEENYISRLNLYLEQIWIPGQMPKNYIKSWGSVANSVYDSDLGIRIRTSGYLKKIVEEQIAGITEPEQKINALYDYVKKSVSWNDVTDVLPDREFKEVLEKKSGSSSEINGLLIALLKKADIEAEPVLVRTRDEGFVKPFLPIFSQFNDVICQAKIGDKVMLIDATHMELPIHILPKRCINGEGLLIAKDIFKWVELTSPKSRMSISTDFELEESGSLTGKIIISHDGLYGSSMRKVYKKEGEENYVKSFLQSKAWEVSNTTFENIDDYTKAAKENYELLIPEFGQATGETIYLNPIVYGREEENPFTTDKRDYPVDYGHPFDEVYMGKIKIPDGYQVEEIPKSKIIMLPEGGGKFVFNVTMIGNTINVLSQFIINKSSFDTDQYLNLREFYTQVVAKQNEQIVLKKK